MNERTIPFGKPIIDGNEKQAVLDVLDGPILVHGPRIRQFEEAFAAYTHGRHATSVSSCTAGMHMVYFALGLGSGDEVIVPAQTHTATAHAVELTGARPVFVDAESATGNIDVARIEEAITPRTRAIAVVHFLGMPVDMDRVNAIAKRHGLVVLEDCALAMGTYYKGVHAGLLGDIGCFSFYPVKHMTTAEGGMVLSKDEKLTVQIGKIRAFGVDRHMGERSVPGVYDVNMLGFNYRMNEIQAALGIEQLKKLDGFIEKRRHNYEALEGRLREIDEIGLFQSTCEGFQSSYYCLSILLREEIRSSRFEIVDALKKRGVGTSVYYPKPVPHMTYYREKYRFSVESFPMAARISYGSIALPVGPHLDIEDMDYIADSLKNAILEVR